MTDLLEHALLVTRHLPPTIQDDIAMMMLAMAGEEIEPVELSPEDEAALDEAEAAEARGEFASDEEIRAIWAKHGL